MAVERPPPALLCARPHADAHLAGAGQLARIPVQTSPQTAVAAHAQREPGVPKGTSVTLVTPVALPAVAGTGS